MLSTAAAALVTGFVLISLPFRLPPGNEWGEGGGWLKYIDQETIQDGGGGVDIGLGGGVGGRYKK